MGVGLNPVLCVFPLVDIALKVDFCGKWEGSALKLRRREWFANVQTQNQQHVT